MHTETLSNYICTNVSVTAVHQLNHNLSVMHSVKPELRSLTVHWVTCMADIPASDRPLPELVVFK